MLQEPTSLFPSGDADLGKLEAKGWGGWGQPVSRVTPVEVFDIEKEVHWIFVFNKTSICNTAGTKPSS